MPCCNWLNGRNSDKGIGNELDKRSDKYKPEPDGRRTNSVIDLSFGGLSPQGRKIGREKLDPEFGAFAISQIYLFVFVGQDPTSSTICYILHLLGTNPNAFLEVRAEHERLLGTDLSANPSMVEEHAHLTKDSTNNTAIIREAPRLIPQETANHVGSPSAHLLDDQGNCCPTKD